MRWSSYLAIVFLSAGRDETNSAGKTFKKILDFLDPVSVFSQDSNNLRRFG
jgi:hypothetical protein